MMGVRNYRGRKFKSLSVTPVNDIKDFSSMLESGTAGNTNDFRPIERLSHSSHQAGTA